MIIINSRFLTQSVTGVQRYAIELSLRLKQLDPSIEFVCPGNVVQHDIFEQLNAKITGKRTGHLWEQIDLPQYLKKQGNPLLLNLCNTAPICYKNKTVTIHDVAFNVYPKTYSKSFLYLYKFLIPNIIKTSGHIFTVSNFSKQEIIRFYKVSEEKISVVYNAVNDSFKPVYDPDLRNIKYLLAVSSLNHRKNLTAILQAFNIISAKNKDIQLYLIGDLETKSFTKIDISEYLQHPQIKILGRVPDSELIKYYSNAKGFLYPSLYEGFGIPPLEAQNCACPVLVSNAGSLPEIFRDSALFCDPFSIDSIAANMLKLLDDNVCELLKAKNKQNITRFSWKQSAMDIFNSL
ncbi:MAG: glycosyltransferase family 4 protein [Bacteroidales bacterium]|jgi:glycosyltransferase involved in cell wall biosynthesis|nr:glycosyltransferase family 4 protein [Bacteroidales bacterium]